MAPLLPVGRREDTSGGYLACVSPPMQALAASMVRIAATAAPVLICGETGSGKSALAQRLYTDSPWRAAPLHVLHGATATADAVERVARLSDRTVLLEEVGEFAPVAQDSLIRVFTAQPAVRFISTSTRDLRLLARQRLVRPDLLYRLDVVRLEIPPLRERPDDILFLATHFLALAARCFQRDVRGFSPEAQARLLAHRWTGNVRELRNCVLESALHGAGATLRRSDLRLRPEPAAPDPGAELAPLLSRLHAAHPADFLAGVERQLLQWALETCNGNHSRAAALLDIGRGALRARLRRHGLDRVANARAAGRGDAAPPPVTALGVADRKRG